MPKASPKKKKVAPSGALAVIATGGKQYLVAPGETITIEQFAKNPKVGEEVVFEEVLLKKHGEALELGAPTVSGAKVKATVVAVGKKPTVSVIKYKAKSRTFKKYGHRQPYLKVHIASV